MFRKFVLMALALLLMGSSLATPVFAQGDDADAAIAVALSNEEISAFLATNEGWEAGAYYEEGEGFWFVEFFMPYSDEEDEGEWLGFAMVSLDSNEVVEMFLPIPLTDDEYEEQLVLVEATIRNDPRVTTLLGDLSQYSMWFEYDRYEQVWYVEIYRGLESYYATLYVFAEANEEPQAYLQELGDANELTEEEQRYVDRYTAIDLAFSADGIDQVLLTDDEWQTYVSLQDDNIYSVIFATSERELFYALVDIENMTVIESRVLGS